MADKNTVHLPNASPPRDYGVPTASRPPHSKAGHETDAWKRQKQKPVINFLFSNFGPKFMV